MEREEERERRRLRDRQRRQSMSKEQRERHLARRRRNYQLRRQRAANSKLMSLPQSTAAGVGEALDTTTANQTHTLPHETLQLLQGSSIQLEGSPRRLRLSSIKRLARNLAISAPHGHHQQRLSSVAHVDGTITKSLRLNSVKRLARSLSSTQENTAPQNNHIGTVTNT